MSIVAHGPLFFPRLIICKDLFGFFEGEAGADGCFFFKTRYQIKKKKSLMRL